MDDELVIEIVEKKPKDSAAHELVVEIVEKKPEKSEAREIVEEVLEERMEDNAVDEVIKDIVEEKLEESAAREIVEEVLEEKLEDSAAREIVEEVLEEKLEDSAAREIVEEVLEDRLEDSAAREVVEDVLEERLEDSVAREVVEEVLEEVLEDGAASEIVEEVLEDRLEDSVAHEIVEEIVEDEVEERLEDRLEQEIKEDIVRDIAHAALEESAALSALEDSVEEALEDHGLREDVAEDMAERMVENAVARHLVKDLGDPDPGASTSAWKEEVQEERQKAEDGTKMKSVLCALIICMGSFAFGTVIGYPSPAVLDINHHINPFHLDPGDQSWMGSIITLLALFGGLTGGPCMDILGRRTAIMVWTVPFTVGWIIMIAAPTTGCMLAGRAVTGLCTGIFSVVCPVYIGEISPPSIRGLLGSCHQMAVCLGIFFIYAFGSFLPWTWAAFACEATILVLACGMVFIPESPRWLLYKQRRLETEQALLWLRGPHVDLKWEMMDLEDAIALSKDKASPLEFLQPQLYKPLLISMGLMLFQQFSGINVIMFYGASIFEDAGIDLDPNMQNMIVGAVGVVGTLVSVFIADMAGRKVLLVASAAIMAVSIGGMGAFFYEKKYDEDFALGTLNWLPVTALVLFNFGFNVAFGPIPWVMMSEIFPLRAKALASSTATAFNWLLAFLLTKFWSDMTVAMSVAGAYWFCTAFCALAIPFTIFLVPETKGRTLDEITASFH